MDGFVTLGPVVGLVNLQSELYDDVKPGTVVYIEIGEVLTAVVPPAAAVVLNRDMGHETW